jgi:hypothetical protein
MPNNYSYAENFGGAKTWMPSDATDIHTYESINKTKVSEGETRLMLAVLEDAVRCFQKYVARTHPREQRLFQEAEDWFLDNESDYIFSFEYICESLGLHPDQIRRGLMTWERLKAEGHFDSVADQSPSEANPHPAHPKTKPTQRQDDHMTELTITAASHLLIGLLGATGLILSVVSIWKANQFSDRLRGFSKGIIWSAFAVVGVCAIVLYANSPETVRAFEIISYRVAIVIRGLFYS